MTRYSHIVRAVGETPWAIRPTVLAVIIDLLTYRAEGHRLTAEEIEERIGAARTRAQPSGRGGVAIIPIYGVLAPRAAIFAQTSTGGTGVDQLRAALRSAVASGEVDSILLDIDSPGGQVDQIPELAAEIRDARRTKPILALSNTDAASAAYWLGAQANEFMVTPSGQVGSIGVFGAHEDVSKLQEIEGRKITLVSAGKYKVEGNPYEPLAEEARAEMQARVDEYYDMFIADVAKGRGVTSAVVRSKFGEGRMVTAPRAVELGMADRVGTFDDALRRVQRMPREAGHAVAEVWVDGLTAGSYVPNTSGTIQSDDLGTGSSSFAEHGELVLATVQAFMRRAQDRHGVRAAAGRKLSAGDRQRLTTLAEELRDVLPELHALTADPAEEALQVEAEYLALVSRLPILTSTRG